MCGRDWLDDVSLCGGARAFLFGLCLKDTASREMTEDGKLERHAESETETMAHAIFFFAMREAP